MGQSVGDSPGGHSDIKERNCAFQPVVAGLMKKIAQSDVCGIFSDKVHRQRGGVSVENTDDGIQFASAALQILMSDGEICGTQRDGGRKQNDVRLIPEPVLSCLQGSPRCWLHGRCGSFKRRLRRIECEILTEYGRATDAKGCDGGDKAGNENRKIARCHRSARQTAQHVARRNRSTTCPTLE
jgi:hypothetical protein